MEIMCPTCVAHLCRNLKLQCCRLLMLLLSSLRHLFSQAQQHRTFNSAVQKQVTLSCAKPLYGLNGRTPLHHNGLSTEAADVEEMDEEVHFEDI